MKVHFIGMGKMGRPMARHLAAAGYAVTVSDLSEDQLAQARAEGLRVADAQAAIEAAEVVVSSLPNDAALRAVGFHVARTARAGAAFVDTSTVSPQVSELTARACGLAGVDYLRATVSGNNLMAEQAQLTVFASGERRVFDRLLPLLACFGPGQFWLGEGEEARVMKLVVNLAVVQTAAMLAEALVLGRKSGLDWAGMWQVLGASAVASPLLKSKGTLLRERDFSPTFSVEQMIKDVDLILEQARQAGVSLPQTAHTRTLLEQARGQGLAHEDYAAMIKVVEAAAGL